ncbi:DUF3791 domain-containing protein [Wielerella bovis]|uniref:DUF3791 domain-containing protein n=1 Tax=Wielerella bovis TaxID=2917790 RepID=UPI00201969A0|nr:DUF3791 domain-containing protein [Wielerella bovis]ULJ63088.1 DUF3791 domain-containing protein [Wielerella bovis]ULJ65318.1 DUF3791 domain-containing protein [Wielerella bovis]ULJ67665.1 DUF3791 domain-containing protein [Wielerella bovis]
MSKEGQFFIYLLERYAEYKQTSANKILYQWEQLGLTEFIFDMYELYHIERLQNAFDDIDKLMHKAA